MQALYVSYMRTICVYDIYVDDLIVVAYYWRDKNQFGHVNAYQSNSHCAGLQLQY